MNNICKQDTHPMLTMDVAVDVARSSHLTQQFYTTDARKHSMGMLRCGMVVTGSYPSCSQGSEG